jgi:hypothetical protein
MKTTNSNPRVLFLIKLKKFIMPLHYIYIMKVEVEGTKSLRRASGFFLCLVVLSSNRQKLIKKFLYINICLPPSSATNSNPRCFFFNKIKKI